ncbi:MAG: DUF1501 domain-containing protein [Planctomycetaceae bacterium]
MNSHSPVDRLLRRRFLQVGGGGLLGLTLPQLLGGREIAGAPASGVPLSSSFGRAKACIFLFMWGGPAQQETWDLKPHAPAEIRGEFQPIATDVPGVFIGEHFPLLSQRVSDLSIIRSVTHTDVNHLTATHYLLTGHAPPPTDDLRADWPHMGSVLSHLGRGTDPLPAFISMRPKLENDVPRFVEQSHGQFAGWLGQQDDPFTIDANPGESGYRIGDFALPAEISDLRLAERRRLLGDLERPHAVTQTTPMISMDRHYERAFELLNSASGHRAFRLDEEPDELRDRYGRNPHGQSVLQARRLIEAGVPIVTVFWPNDGIKNVSVYWDTHSRNFIDLKERLMPVTDQAFSALIDDLKARGMFDDTLVIWSGEFGRTPRIGQVNSDAGAGRDGRDHWPNCFSTVLTGGGIAGGQVYGTSDRHAAYPASNAVAPVDVVATAYHLLGVPAELSLKDVQGREQVICPGRPIHDVMA